jgi:hypothetical protein
MAEPESEHPSNRPDIGTELATTVVMLLSLALATLFLATLIGALHVFG